MTEPILVAQGVERSYGTIRALRGIDLSLERGRVTALVGPNGAGKTTLISVIAGLLYPDAGSVHVNGVDVLAQPQRARAHLGLAPQRLGLYPTVTVRDNLIVFGELGGMRGPALRHRIDEVCEVMGLQELLGRRARELSGGEQRRLHVGLALVHQPPVVVLDEPTSGVDVSTRIALLELVRSLASGGVAVLYSTNVLSEVDALDPSVAILDEGRVVARGARQDVIGAHASSLLEFTFDGPPPAIDLANAQTSGSVVRVASAEPERLIVAVLERLGPQAARLRGVEVVKPSLESAFLALTGRRYDAEQQDAEIDVPPA